MNFYPDIEYSAIFDKEQNDWKMRPVVFQRSFRPHKNLIKELRNILFHRKEQKFVDVIFLSFIFYQFCTANRIEQVSMGKFITFLGF